MLHLFIYALEAYKYHYTADQIGTGALLEDPNFKAEDLNVSGSVAVSGIVLWELSVLGA